MRIKDRDYIIKVGNFIEEAHCLILYSSESSQDVPGLEATLLIVWN